MNQFSDFSFVSDANYHSFRGLQERWGERRGENEKSYSDIYLNPVFLSYSVSHLIKYENEYFY